MAARTGLPTLRLLGRTLCLFMAAWGPKIRQSHGDNQDLMTVLDSIDAICQTLEVVVSEAIPKGD